MIFFLEERHLHLAIDGFLLIENRVFVRHVVAFQLDFEQVVEDILFLREKSDDFESGEVVVEEVEVGREFEQILETGIEDEVVRLVLYDFQMEEKIAQQFEIEVLEVFPDSLGEDLVMSLVYPEVIHY